MKAPKVSVVIRTFNEEKKIGRCLNAIFSQKINMPFEVIIVDSESSDKTLEIASRFPVKIIRMKKKDFTYGKALNIGCNAAKGDYLVFISAHAAPLPGWLDNLIKPFKDKKTAGVFGKQVPEKDCNPLSRRQIIRNWRKGKLHFSNANSAIRKDVWMKLRFNEKLTASEDLEWQKRAESKGFLIIYGPDAIVIHSHNENLRQLYTRYHREDYANLLIHGKKLIFIYLCIPFSTLYHDVRYIIKDRQGIYWIMNSFMNSALLLAAAISAFLRSIK